MKKTLGIVSGSVALILSTLAIIPSSGPFTGALYIIYITIPLALIAVVFGAWRTALGSIYFSLSCLVVSPMVWNPLENIDIVLAGLMFTGIVLNIALYWHYRKKYQRA